jgi:tetratricopeptide (TPR) repeat protein
MIYRFFSGDSRSLGFAIFCGLLVACQPAAWRPSNGIAQPDPEAATSREQLASHVSPNDPNASPPNDQTNPITTKEDPRPPLGSGSKPRARALLVTELSMLEQLAAETPISAPDRSQLVRRMAEDWAELERSAQTAGDEATRNKARNKAISNYVELVQNHPDYPKLDEALYYLAAEYESANDRANARHFYTLLVTKAPASRFVPNAYLAFGEMFFDEATEDPAKLDLALSAYQRVLRDPPPRNDAYGYAWYKLAWVLRNKGDREGALEAFNHAIDYATEFASAPGAAKLAEASRSDLRSL